MVPEVLLKKKERTKDGITTSRKHSKPLPLGEPCAVYLDVEGHYGNNEEPPEGEIVSWSWGDEGRGLEEEEPGDPRGEHVVDAHVVLELVPDEVEVGEAAEGVEGGEGEVGEEREGPEDGEGRGREERAEEAAENGGVGRGGRGVAEGLPEQSLAAQREADAEVTGVEPGYERDDG